MRRSALIATVGLGVVVVVLGTAFTAMYLERPTTVRVAIASSDVEDYGLMTAVAKLLKHDRSAIRLKLVDADGVASASEALDRNTADLAVVRTDVAMPAVGDTVVLLHKDVGLLVAPNGSDLAKIADLEGKTIGMISSGPGDLELLQTALTQYDLAQDAVKRIPLKVGELSRAFADKTIDAAYVVGMTSSGQVPAAVRAIASAGGGPPVFLPVAEADAVTQRVPGYESIEVARGTFGGTPPRPAEEFDTLGVAYRLVAREDLDSGVVAALTRFLLSQRAALAAISPVARRMEAPSTDKGAVLQVHPGTAAYIDDEEETFLDRYSDFIYIGAMVLGVIASGATAIISRLGASRGVRADDILARLLMIFRAARIAPSASALDDCEAEVDTIVADALETGWLSGLDDRRVAALNMALDQVRTAIRDRRTSLRHGLEAPIASSMLIEDSSVAPLKIVQSQQTGTSG